MVVDIEAEKNKLLEETKTNNRTASTTNGFGVFLIDILRVTQFNCWEWFEINGKYLFVWRITTTK